MSELRVPFVDFPAQFESQRDSLLKTVERVLSEGKFVGGPEVSQFEDAFRELTGSKYAVALNSGTDALIFALLANGIGPGDEVITVSNSWVSSASCIALIGAKPVFVDVGDDFLIDTNGIERAITAQTKAIIPVHLTGRMCDMTAVLSIAKKARIPVIEDSAQAIQAKRDGHIAGGSGQVGCFSLHPLKNLNAVGDAGIAVTSDEKVAEKLRSLRNHGLADRDTVSEWGYNSRLDTIQASVLLTRIPLIDSIVKRRREVSSIYNEGLRDLVECPVEHESDFHTFHLFVIQCDRREDLIAHLRANGIGTKIHYPIPIHLQPAAQSLGYKEGSLPVTEKQSGRILSIPVHPYLSDQQVEYVISSIKSFYSK